MVSQSLVEPSAALPDRAAGLQAERLHRHHVGAMQRHQAMRGAHEAAAYNQWLAGEIQASIDDPRPSIPYDEVMAEMDADIAALPKKKRA